MMVPGTVLEARESGICLPPWPKVQLGLSSYVGLCATPDSGRVTGRFDGSTVGSDAGLGLGELVPGPKGLR